MYLLKKGMIKSWTTEYMERSRKSWCQQYLLDVCSGSLHIIGGFRPPLFSAMGCTIRNCCSFPKRAFFFCCVTPVFLILYAPWDIKDQLFRISLYVWNLINGSIHKNCIDEEERLRQVYVDQKKCNDDTILGLKKENKALQDRLSKSISQHVIQGNEEIEDLSSDNRPLNIAKQYQHELYSTPWAEAYDELMTGDASEDDTLAALLEICLMAYNVTGWSTKQLPLASVSESSITVNSFVIKIPEDLSEPDISSLNIGNPGDKDSSFQHICQIVKEETKRRHALDALGDATEKYIVACAKLTLQMHIQNPPMYLSTPAVENLQFNDNMHTAYEQKGKYVNRYVWPVLFFKKGGKVAAKGIVKAINSLEDGLDATVINMGNMDY